ncbi:MAG: DUF378 domain-containing protein [Candidatus Aenigmatarchaeota archaeon]
MKYDLYFVVKLLTIIGAILWLPLAFGYNVIGTLFSAIPVLVQAIYVIIGLCGLYKLYLLFTKK